MRPEARRFFSCACHAEGLILEHDDEDDLFYVALWSYGKSDGRLGWRERLRWCWNILRFGLPWTDCVILHPNEAKALAAALCEPHQCA